VTNVEGRATAITVLTPVKPIGRIVLPLVFWAGRHLTFTLKKLQMLSFIHFARWIVIPRFPDGGRGEKLNYRYLFFESNFNGLWDQYIDAFSEVVPARMKGIWGTSYGFPGPIPVEPFKEYIRRNEYIANHYWSAYPGATTTEISSAEPVARAIEDLRRRADGLSPARFKAAYEQMLTDVQEHL
jgi:hypothetical protein